MARLGPLRHRVTLQTITETIDSGGGTVEVSADVATVWAQIEPLQGREAETARQISADVTHRITIRYRDAVVPKMQVAYGDRVFEIVSSINRNEQDEYIDMLCSEAVD